MTKLRRHIYSALRVFASSFLTVLSLSLASMPTTGLKEFISASIVSAMAAGFSAILKLFIEYLDKISNKQKRTGL